MGEFCCTFSDTKRVPMSHPIWGLSCFALKLFPVFYKAVQVNCIKDNLLGVEENGRQSMSVFVIVLYCLRSGFIGFRCHIKYY